MPSFAILTTEPEPVFYPEYHRPTIHRYRAAEGGARAMWNRYANSASRATIGLAIVVGKYAYCLKWARARARSI
ncbi:hypothetical protein [Streptomyces sp. NPDC101455]|uniref:hypothetical protein n=1 Tax=Streptomyces sp. NPDC101455 TaxID=3366142 RepID=UPI003805F772